MQSCMRTPPEFNAHQSRSVHRDFLVARRECPRSKRARFPQFDATSSPFQRAGNGIGVTAGNADRAVPVRLIRFPAVVCLTCGLRYQRADTVQLRKALDNRPRVRG